MFRALIGDLFASRAQTLVNTVNCVGVMGKGVAEQFKLRCPAMFEDYKSRTDRKAVRLRALWANGLASFIPRFPLREREDIRSFAALVGPGVDRPKLIGLAISDHCRVVWALSNQKPRHRRGNCMVLQQFELIENEQE